MTELKKKKGNLEYIAGPIKYLLALPPDELLYMVKNEEKNILKKI